MNRPKKFNTYTGRDKYKEPETKYQKNLTSLRSIQSVTSEENYYGTKSSAPIRTDDKVETMINEIHIVQPSHNNNISNYLLEDEDKLNEEGERLINKLKEGIKETKQKRNIVLLTNNNIPTTSSNNFLTKISLDSSKTNRYEQYNTEQLAYKAYNKYSKCRPKDANFLDRMKFYAIKNQTKFDAVNIIVEKSKKKISEKEKILTFNRLIEDSNRRAEVKNRINLIHSNKDVATEMFDNKNNMIHPPKKKFDKDKWEKRYKSQIQKVNERQRSCDLLRKQKEEEQKMKEDQEVEQMKKYRRTASKEQISMISERLYNEGRTHRVKSVSNLRLRNSYMSNLNSTYSDMRKKSKQSSPYKKKNYFKKYSFQSQNNDKYSEKNSIRSSKINTSYTKIKNNDSHKTKSKNYVTSLNAEKLIESFFIRK